MYKFCPIDQAPDYSRGLCTEYAGVNLDHRYLQSFKTLNVTGRGLLAPDIRHTEKIGAAGAWLDSAELPARMIEVEAMIQSDHLRPIYNDLARIMAQKAVRRLVFSDEGEYYFNAILERVEAPKEDRNNMIITLCFFCPDPFKYKTEETIEGTGRVAFNKETIWPATISRILVENVKDGNLKILFEGTGKRIIFNGFVASEVSGQRDVLFDFQEGKVTAGGVNLTHKLSLDSDFELMELLPISDIVVTPAQTKIKLWYQERML